MAICRGFSPGYGRRKMAHAQRCGALAEEGEEFCAVHMKAAGRQRCACGAWTGTGMHEGRWVQRCPKGCLPSTVNGSVKAD